MPNIRKTKKCCIHAKTSFTRATHPIYQTSEKTKSAANIRKAAFPGQTSDVSNIRKTKMWCKHAKTSFTRANIRCVKHPENQKVLQTCENQLYHGEHPICQKSEKLKSAANIRKAAFPGQTSDMSDIRKTKKCCIHAKTSFTRATHPIYQTSEKTKSAANIRKAAFPGQTSDVSNIRKTKMWCKHAKTSFTRANIRYVKHPKNQKVLQLSENQLYHGKHPICQTSEKPKSAANIRKPVLRGQTSGLSNIQKLKSAANIRKTKKCCNYPKTSFSMANIRCVKHPENQKVLQTCENQLYHGEHPICQISEKAKSAANIRKAVLP